MRTIALDRLESSLAVTGVKTPAVAVQNTPPQVFVSRSPAILVPIDGAQVLKAVPQSSRFQRIVNTKALILQGGFGGGDRFGGGGFSGGGYGGRFGGGGGGRFGGRR